MLGQQGSDEFRASQKNLAEIGSEKFLEHVLAKSHADIDEWETEMLLRAERASAGNIHMWSPGLSAVSRNIFAAGFRAGFPKIDSGDLAGRRTVR